MKTERATVEPLLARLSVIIPPAKPKDGEQRPPSTLYTMIARETTDDN
jgi:hypothetical protein